MTRQWHVTLRVLWSRAKALHDSHFPVYRRPGLPVVHQRANKAQPQVARFLLQTSLLYLKSLCNKCYFSEQLKLSFLKNWTNFLTLLPKYSALCTLERMCWHPNLTCRAVWCGGGGPHLQPFSFSDLSGPLAPPHLLRPGPALILQQDHPSSSSFAFPSPAKWASYLD